VGGDRSVDRERRRRRGVYAYRVVFVPGAVMDFVALYPFLGVDAVCSCATVKLRLGIT
jgi:hypothetical protein